MPKKPYNPHDTLDDLSFHAVAEGYKGSNEQKTVQVRRTVKGALGNVPAVVAKPAAQPPAIPRSHLRQTLKDVPVVDSASAEKVDYIAAYHQEYVGLPADIKKRATWEKIEKRLTGKDHEKLKLAQAMQGGGQLFGIDKDGKALFKDKGTHPVMYGCDGKGDPITIYDRDTNSEDMEKVKRWMDGEDIRGQVHKDGYELFKDDGNGFRSGGTVTFGLGDEMMQAQKPGKPFIFCKAHNLMSWVESKDGQLHVAIGYKNGGGVDIRGDISSTAAHDKLGVIRMLRV